MARRQSSKTTKDKLQELKQMAAGKKPIVQARQQLYSIRLIDDVFYIVEIDTGRKYEIDAKEHTISEDSLSEFLNDPTNFQDGLPWFEQKLLNAYKLELYRAAVDDRKADLNQIRTWTVDLYGGKTEENIVTFNEFGKKIQEKNTYQFGDIKWEEIGNYDDEPIREGIGADHPIIDTHHPIEIERQEQPLKCLTYDPDAIEFEEVKEEKKVEEVKPKAKPIKPTVIMKTSGKVSEYGEGWRFGFAKDY